MRILYVTLAVLIADQLTKLSVKGITIPGLGISVDGLNYGESIALIGDWLKLTYIENPNMAFGLAIAGKLFLVIFSFIASIGIVVYLYRHRSEGLLFRLALALILAGAVGNLIDRSFYGLIHDTAPLFYGNVVDFIDVDLFTISLGGSSFKFWPIFNIADAAVSVGVVTLLIVGMPRPAQPSSSDASAAGEEASSPDATVAHPAEDAEDTKTRRSDTLPPQND
ncbi:MAG: signal peptidase II [Ignavibacteria bacterium]|nr:MAG: signal peptidase II [Ignavibacteria bacterium]